MKPYLKIILIACVIAPLQVFASNYSFLSDSPISYFSAQDSQIFAATQNSTLNKTRDGVKVTWENPKTKAHGYFIPSNTTKENGVICRKLTIATSAAGRNGLSTFKYCKINNIWNPT